MTRGWNVPLSLCMMSGCQGWWVLVAELFFLRTNQRRCSGVQISRGCVCVKAVERIGGWCLDGDCKANIRSSKVHGDIPLAAKERQEGLEQGTKAYKCMGNSPQAYKDDKRVYKRDEDDIDPSQGGIRSQTKSIKCWPWGTWRLQGRKWTHWHSKGLAVPVSNPGGSEPDDAWHVTMLYI